jgi:glutathione S-transferase
LVAKYGRGSALDTRAEQTFAELAAYEQTASVEYSYFDPAMKSLAYENIFKKYSAPPKLCLQSGTLTQYRFMGHGDPDKEEVEKQKTLLVKVLDHYEKATSDREYLTGNVSGSPSFTLKSVLNF